MRFLDIDLDAFLDNVKHWVEPEAGRLDDKDFTPWKEERLREFLETQCGLSHATPIDGWFVEHHDTAFHIMLDLVEGGSGPLEVVHIDAHADLGFGDSSWVDIINRVARPLPNRRNPSVGHGGLNPGSWLAYALAAELVSELVYVYPDGWGADLHPLYFPDRDMASGQLLMKAFTRGGLPMMGTVLDYDRLCDLKPDVTLPPVPFSMVTLDDYKTTSSFDVGLLCHSPNFTPAASDRLIPIIGEYLRLEPWPST